MVKEDNCMEPLVSVIIPVYNVLPYLREALDSVINQTYKNLEILVVDDGSTDGSGEVCDEYLSDPRVIVIHQENKGLSGARNTALDRMTGEYVAFLDSDDAYMPEMIEKMLDAIVQNCADAAICGYIACFTEKPMDTPGIKRTEVVHFKNRKKLSTEEALNMLITNKICWAVWTKLYKRSVWTNIRFPEGKNYEDMHVMCKVFEQCAYLVTVPDIHVYYRRRGSSITQSQTEKNLLDHLLAILSVEEYIRKYAPARFPLENMYLFLERYARVLSDLYARLLICPHSIDTMTSFKKETLFFWERLGSFPCQFHSRVTRFLFLHAPILLLPARSCWQAGKHLLGKVRA